MLKKLDALWIKHLITGFITVLTALVSIDFLGKLFDEMGDLQETGYTLSAVLNYCLLITPSRFLTFFPMSILVGALIGLGRLAQSGELTVMQVSSYSKKRIALLGCLTSITIGVGTLFLTEFVAQPLKQYAESYRYENKGQLSSGVSMGFWAEDNNRILSVGGVKSNGNIGYVRQFYASDTTKNPTIDTTLVASEANFVKGGWELINVTTKTFKTDRIEVKKYPTIFWKTNLEPDIAQTLANNADDLTLRNLYQFTQFQKRNGIKAQQYEILIFSRLLLPLTGAVMLILALPFSFGHTRSGNLSKQITIGMTLGLIYFIVNGSITNIVLLTGLPVIIGAFTPIVIFTITGLIGLKLSH